MTVALLLIVGLAAGLRVYHLGYKSLWYDEANTWFMVQGSWREIIELNATTNSAPPLYPLLLGLSTGFDASEAVLRLPALLAGIAAVPLVWLLAREFVRGWPALLAPLLVALAPTQVEYSQQVREYSLAFCAATLLLLCAVRFLRAPAPQRALWLGLAAAAGLLIQYGIGLLLVGVNLLCLVVLWPRPDARRGRNWHPLGWWVAAQVPAAIAAGVLLLTTLPSQLAAVRPGNSGYLAPYYWDGTSPGVWSLLTAGRADLVHFAYPGKLMAALVITGLLAWLVAWLWPSRRRDPLPATALALLLLPALLTAGAALLHLYPYGGIRQDLFLLPMIYVAAAAGLGAGYEWLQARVSGGYRAVVPLAISVALIASGLPRTLAQLDATWPEPLRPVVETLATKWQPGDRIYVYDGAQPAFRYYWRQRTEPWVAGLPHGAGLDATMADADRPLLQAELLALLARRERWWIVASHLADAELNQLLEPVRKQHPLLTVTGEHGSWLFRTR